MDPLSGLRPEDKPSLSLCGDSYAFCGPKMSCVRFQDTPGFKDSQVFDLVNEKDADTFVVLGSANRYFRCTSPRGGDVQAVCDSRLDNYDELAEFLDHHQTTRPAFLSLGHEGHFYARVGSGVEKWDVPTDVSARVFQKHTGGEGAIEGLWLGFGNAFVAQRWDGGKMFDLRGQFRGLQSILADRFASEDENTADIASLALDTDGWDNFVVVWRDGTAHRAAGMRNTAAGRAFEQWCVKNQFDLLD